VAEGLDGDEWAAHEFGGADLGDKRTNERLIEFVRISANVTGDFGNVTDPGLGAGLRG